MLLLLASILVIVATRMLMFIHKKSQSLQNIRPTINNSNSITNNSNNIDDNNDDDDDITKFRYRFNDISVFEDYNPKMMMMR